MNEKKMITNVDYYIEYIKKIWSSIKYVDLENITKNWNAQESKLYNNKFNDIDSSINACIKELQNLKDVIVKSLNEKNKDGDI